MILGYITTARIDLWCLSCDWGNTQDQLAEMVASVNEMRVDALDSNPYCNSPFPASELAHLNRKLRTRDERQLLLSSRTQRVLSKLAASRAWKPTRGDFGPRYVVDDEAGEQFDDNAHEFDAVPSLFDQCTLLHSTEALSSTD